MGGRTIKTLIAVLMSLLTACSHTRRPGGCTPPAEVISRFESLRAVDWRTRSWEVAPIWSANPERVFAQATHKAVVVDGVCECGEVLDFASDGGERRQHLYAIAIVQPTASYGDAVALANNILEAAQGPERFAAIPAQPQSAAFLKPFGWLGLEYDTILNVSVSNHRGAWLANVYWARLYATKQGLR